MSILPAVTLQGRYVRLEPLSLAHVPGLVTAAAGPRDTYGFTRVPANEAEMQAYVEEAIARHGGGDTLAFATVDVRGGEPKVVGSTRFSHAERWAWPRGFEADRPASIDAVEIGWTWLTASAQRTAINTEAKLLMLGHAFEAWRLLRVTLKTDARNSRSRAAIERLGAKLDGVLRAHMPAYTEVLGEVRDTATFSIVRAEWPSVKERLMARLGERP